MNGYARRMVFAAKIRAQVQYLSAPGSGRNGRFIYPLFLRRRLHISDLAALYGRLLQMNVSLRVCTGTLFAVGQMSALRPLNFTCACKRQT